MDKLESMRPIWEHPNFLFAFERILEPDPFDFMCWYLRDPNIESDIVNMQTVGTLWFGCHGCDPESSDVRVLSLSVHPEYRRKGLASWLVRALASCLPPTSNLYLSDQSSIIGFYAKLGFRPFCASSHARTLTSCASSTSSTSSHAGALTSCTATEDDKNEMKATVQSVLFATRSCLRDRVYSE